MVIGATTLYPFGTFGGAYSHNHILYLLNIVSTIGGGALFVSSGGSYANTVSYTYPAGAVSESESNMPPYYVLPYIWSKGVGGIPANGILGWTNTAANIPGGWHLCDGTAGTKNLTNRFVLCAGNGFNTDDIGGTNQHGHHFTIPGSGSAHAMSAGGFFQSGAGDYANFIVANDVIIDLSVVSHLPPAYAFSFIQNTSGVIQGSYTGFIGIWPSTKSSGWLDKLYTNSRKNSLWRGWKLHQQPDIRRSNTFTRPNNKWHNIR